MCTIYPRGIIDLQQQVVIIQIDGIPKKIFMNSVILAAQSNEHQRPS